MLDLKLYKIDDSNRTDHGNIKPSDHCYYFGDYYPRAGFGHSPMNQLIYNFKKYMTQRGKTGWHYKEEAINQIAQTFLALDIWPKLKQYTWVPMPSSKLKDDPEFDDRLMKTLTILQDKETDLDIREILTIKNPRTAAHDPETYYRPTVEEHQDNFQVTGNLLTPMPKAIAIFDDVLTTGASFRAAKNKLQNHFQASLLIIGIFIARTIPQ